jgi:hypothetical protein
MHRTADISQELTVKVSMAEARQCESRAANIMCFHGWEEERVSSHTSRTSWQYASRQAEYSSVRAWLPGKVLSSPQPDTQHWILSAFCE